MGLEMDTFLFPLLWTVRFEAPVLLLSSVVDDTGAVIGGVRFIMEYSLGFELDVLDKRIILRSPLALLGGGFSLSPGGVDLCWLNELTSLVPELLNAFLPLKENETGCSLVELHIAHIRNEDSGY